MDTAPVAVADWTVRPKFVSGPLPIDATSMRPAPDTRMPSASSVVAFRRMSCPARRPVTTAPARFVAEGPVVVSTPWTKVVTSVASSPSVTVPVLRNSVVGAFRPAPSVASMEFAAPEKATS